MSVSKNSGDKAENLELQVVAQGSPGCSSSSIELGGQFN